MTAPDEEFPVDHGSPLALALATARAAAERGDVTGADTGYRRAVRLAHGTSARLRAAVAAEHVSRLRALHDSTAALARCAEYLAEYGADLRLLLLRVETELTRGDYSRLETGLAQVHRLAAGRPLHRADKALLSRLDGLAAAHHGRLSPARQHLRQARDGYAALDDPVALAAVDDDIRAVGLPAAGRSARSAHRSPQTRLTRAEELRTAGRYEEALAELTPALDGPLDPALRFFFLEAQVRLLRQLRANPEASALMPALYAAAEASAQPERNRLAAQRLDSARAGLGILAGSDHSLQQVRRLVREGELESAERALVAEPAPAEHDDRHAAEWHLAAAELTLAIARRDGDPAAATQAVAHCAESIGYAAADALVPIRISAQRVCGHAYAHLQNLDEAVEAWAAAHRLEEWVAARQPTDRVRLRMLRGVADEFDQRIRWAQARADDLGDARATAAIVVAMEAARGAAILSRILPGRAPLRRELPAPGDVAGARRWIRREMRGLPGSQLIWMLHATQGDVHHIFITRGPLHRLRIRHQAVPCERHLLIETIEALVTCWSDGGARLLARARPGTTRFDRLLGEVAIQLGLHRLPELPGHVERIAVVAGGELAEIPFALLPCPGREGTLVGRRYALSDLPCLSVRCPLRRRSLRQRGSRGTRMLLVQGPDDPDNPDDRITPAREVPGRWTLPAERATPARLREALHPGRYRQVRIDSHGSFGGDQSQAALLLAPWGPPGRLSPDEFQAMNLAGTGTLVLGACETGMVTRIGRDERTGFVRAALSSGASAVLAARWEAADEVAARLLDRFEQHLRRHPRDVALFLAQREADTPDAHPVRWAAWTLYGDTGHQTRLRPLLRRASNPASGGQR